MLFPMTNQSTETSESDRLPATEKGALGGDRPTAPQASTEPARRHHPVTEVLLDEMGKALAERLNKLVEALRKQS